MTKAQLYDLIVALPEERADEAVRLLAPLFDPVTFSLMTAPEDDEPDTHEERAAVAEARADIAAGRVYSSDEVRRALGL